MFVYEERYEFDWPVTVAYPADGGEVEHTFTGRVVLPDDEDEIYAVLPGETTEEKMVAARERLAQHFVGWSGIQTPDGQDLAYSVDRRDRLLKNRAFRLGVEKAFGEAVLGIREKN